VHKSPTNTAKEPLLSSVLQGELERCGLLLQSLPCLWRRRKGEEGGGGGGVEEVGKKEVVVVEEEEE